MDTEGLQRVPKYRGVSVNGRKIDNLKYADDFDILSFPRDDLQSKLELLDAQAMALVVGVIANVDENTSLVSHNVAKK